MLNLRKEIITPIQNLVKLFKERSEKCSKRKELEKDITADNGILTQQLVKILLPIAKRGIGFNVNITDENIEISTMIIMSFKKGKQFSNIRLSILSHPINKWMSDSKSLDNEIRNIEKYVRFLLSTTREQIKSGKLRFSIPNVTVSINTRNRYFE